MNTSPLMTALRLDHAGKALVLADLPVPRPGAGEVRVRVVAAGLNPLDAKIRAGQAAHAKHPAPAVLGLDMAGIVDAVGTDVIGFAPGDAVYGLTGGVGGIQGSLAPFAVVDAALLAHAPTHLPLADAAALPLGFITAWEGLVDRAHLGAGQTLLVHGGAGGVGSMAVQLGVALGARVVATGSAGQADVITTMGATFFDYRASSIESIVETCTGGEGFDVVYDTLGGATLDASFVAARRYGGHVVSSLGWGTHSLAPLSFRAATYSGVFTLMPLLTGKGREAHGRIMAEATRLADGGKLRPVLSARRFALADGNAALDLVESGDAGGKVIVEIG
ncbi:NADPH2:quinone reductase [Luteibacter sp. 329MFSha]|nr:NADPH2:quinone reductase [Luteibacter sp. 329MFSha]